MKEIKPGDYVPFGFSKRNEAMTFDNRRWRYILKLPLWSTRTTRFDIFAGEYITAQWTYGVIFSWMPVPQGRELHINWGWQR